MINTCVSVVLLLIWMCMLCQQQQCCIRPLPFCCWLLTTDSTNDGDLFWVWFIFLLLFCVLYLRSAKRPNNLNRKMFFFYSTFGLKLFLHLIFHMIIQWGTVDRVTVAANTKYLNRYAYFFVLHSDDHFSRRVFYGNVHYNKILFVCFVFVRISLASDSTHKCNYKYI